MSRTEKPKMHCHEELERDLGYQGVLSDETLKAWSDDAYSTSKHLFTLYSLAHGLSAKQIVEIGFGRSSFVLAKAASELGAKLHCCDTRDFSYLLSPGEREVTEFVHGRSDLLWPRLNQGIDFAFLDYFSDESISEQFVFSELAQCYRLMKQNGVIAVHDSIVEKYAINSAVAKFARELGLEKISLPFNYGLCLLRREEASPFGAVKDLHKKKQEATPSLIRPKKQLLVSKAELDRQVFIPFDELTSGLRGGPKSFMENFRTGLKASKVLPAEKLEEASAIFFPIQYNVDTLRALKAKGIKIIQRLDGVYYPSQHGEAYRELNAKLELIYRELSDLVIFQSEYSRAQCYEVLGPSGASEECVVINGADVGYFFPDSSKVTLAAAPQIVTTGHIRHPIQIKTVVEALDKVTAPFSLVVAGSIEPDLGKYLERPYIRFVNNLSRMQIASLLRESDLFLYSFLNPNCPNSVIEAITTGLPVLGFDSGSMKELCGFSPELLASVSNKTIQLAEEFSPERLREKIELALSEYALFRSRSLENARRFTLSSMTKGYLEAFGKALSRSSIATDNVSKVQVSVLICAFGNEPFTSDILQSVKKETQTLNGEVLVAAPDFSSLPEGVKGIAIAEGRTVAHAKNELIRAARGEVLVFFADMQELEPGCISSHVKFHRQRADERLIAIGETKLSGAAERSMLTRLALDNSFLLGGSKLSAGGKDWGYRNFRFSNVSLRRAALSDCSDSVFDASLVSAEDIDFQYRLERIGFRTALVPQANVIRKTPFRLEDIGRLFGRLALGWFQLAIKFPELTAELFRQHQVHPSSQTMWEKSAEKVGEEVKEWEEALLAAENLGNPSSLADAVSAELSSLFSRLLAYKRMISWIEESKKSPSVFRSLSIGAAMGERQTALIPASRSGGNCFVFVMPTFNMEDTVAQTLKSIAAQSYDDWRVIIRDDMSTDKTVQVIQSTAKQLDIESRVTLIKNTEKFWSLRNCVESIRTCEAKEVICRIDGDDWLCDIDALALINRVYISEGVDALWTKHRFGFSQHNVSGPIPYSVDPYKHPWVSSHLRTFRKALFEQVPEENFLDAEGQYFRRTEDQALYLPILHLAGKKRFFFPLTLYHYSCAREEIENPEAKAFQNDIAQFIRERGFVQG